MGLPHLIKNSKRSEALGNNPDFLNSPDVEKLIGAKVNGCEDAVIKDGEKVRVGNLQLNGAKVINESTEGLPIVIENTIGSGKVIFVNVNEYPAGKNVRKLYEGLLEDLGEGVCELEKYKGWLSCSQDVNFTVYDRGDSLNLRNIYFMNINWWKNESIPEGAVLLWGGNEIELEVRRDDINILTLAQNFAVWTYDNETDVISIDEEHNGGILNIQGMGRTEFTIISSIFNNNDYILQAAGCNEEEIEVTKDKTDNSWKVKLYLQGPAQIKFNVYRRD